MSLRFVDFALFNESVSTAQVMKHRVVKDELERIRKEVAVTCLRICVEELRIITEGLSFWPVAISRFEPATFRT
jgi:TPP-dependent trihydroxycyclohexane-1,2-dione (THcHDO) dehydratase